MQSQGVTGYTDDAPRASVRLHCLDWLRVLAILAVFVYHSTRFFNMETWNVKNPSVLPSA